MTPAMTEKMPTRITDSPLADLKAASVWFIFSPLTGLAAWFVDAVVEVDSVLSEAVLTLPIARSEESSVCEVLGLMLKTGEV